MASAPHYTAVVIGASTGGLAALDKILPQLSANFPLPIFIVLHIGAQEESYLPAHFANRCPLAIKEAEDKEKPKSGVVYFAPPNYHLLLEFDQTLALSTEARINFSRPSIDVLFVTAAEAYREGLIGIVLSGANSDGAKGLARIKECGGLTIVQSPDTASADTMPKAALKGVKVDHILAPVEIGSFLQSLVGHSKT